MMKTRAPHGTALPAPIESVECPILRRAVEHLEQEWGQLTPSDGGQQLTEELVGLCMAVLDARDGRPVRVEQRLTSARGHRLLDALRARVVQNWIEHDDAPDSATVLRYLAAFERVRASVEGRADLSDFSESLLSPDGLTLVVEVAHDLRSPLTSILFLAETIQRGQSGPVSELQQRQLGLIYSAALGLSTVSSNVMEMARGGSRLADEQPSPFSVAETFESVRDMVQPMAEEKGLKVMLNPPDSDRRMGAPQALSRVLLNLTTNAIKFTEEGFVELVGTASSLTRVEFAVRDSGHGIPPEALATLYDPFRKAPSTDRYAFSSTGLGLALCRRLVAAMGADLHVETRPDWGTRFFFEMEMPPARHL